MVQSIMVDLFIYTLGSNQLKLEIYPSIAQFTKNKIYLIINKCLS